MRIVIVCGILQCAILYVQYVSIILALQLARPVPTSELFLVLIYATYVVSV